MQHAEQIGVERQHGGQHRALGSNGSSTRRTACRLTTASVTKSAAPRKPKISQKILPTTLHVSPHSMAAHAAGLALDLPAAGLLSRSRSSLPVLKNGTNFSATDTEAPVRGLRPDARRAVLDREGAEAAQLHPVAARQRLDDLVEDRR